MTPSQSDNATPIAETSWKYFLTIGLVFASVYVANVLYLKLVEDIGVTGLAVFGNGLDPVASFTVLVLMAVFVGASLLFHPGGGAS